MIRLTIFFRILVQQMEDFQVFAKDVTWYIPSKYSGEMSQKSEVVSYKKMIMTLANIMMSSLIQKYTHINKTMCKYKYTCIHIETYVNTI